MNMKLDKENVMDWLLEHLVQITIGVIVAASVIFVIWAIYMTTIQPSEGTVVGKEYSPAYTTTSYRRVTSNDGKSSYEVPETRYHPEQYTIIISGIDKKGNESRGYWNVTALEYDRIQVGDYYIHEKRR